MRYLSLSKVTNHESRITNHELRIMVTYANLFTPNLFLVTNRTVGGEAVLANEMIMRVFRIALDAVQKSQHFRLVGYVFLPERVQLLLEPATGVVLNHLMAATQQRFQLDYQQLFGMPGELLLWEKHYRVQRLNDVADFAAQLDQLHYAPVQQKLVDKPEAWPYSSYSNWLVQGLYPTGWGWTPPTSLKRGEA
jgi:putative transposase